MPSRSKRQMPQEEVQRLREALVRQSQDTRQRDINTALAKMERERRRQAWQSGTRQLSSQGAS